MSSEICLRPVFCVRKTSRLTFLTVFEKRVYDSEQVKNSAYEKNNYSDDGIPVSLENIFLTTTASVPVYLHLMYWSPC